MWYRLVLCVACALVGLSAARHLAAQDADGAASARSLFEAGVRDADAERWADAEGRFRKALVLRDSPVIRFNLAVALLELGQPREASELLRAVRDDSRTGADIAARVPALLESAGERLAHLTILLEGPGEVLLNDRTLREDELGEPLALDPGTYTLRVQRGNEQLEARTLALGEGERQLVALRLPLPEPASAPAAVQVEAPAPRRASTREDDRDRKRRRLGWGIGASAAAVAAGVITGTLLATRGRGEASSPGGTFDPPSIGVRVPQ